MTADSNRLGALGEDAAAGHLEEHGYVVLARNWRCAEGEIDIVAASDDCVVIVEVKTRSGPGAGHPFESITAAKAGRLRRLAVAWAREHPSEGLGLRIDVIGVTGPADGEFVIEHLENAA